MHDTFQRSCQHWSEEGRDEMEKFYTLASVDYQYLAEAVDWKNWIEEQQEMVGKKNLKILDVACGSGKFPLALAKFSNVADARIFPVDYSLLDPSKFSISETRDVLPFPFVADAEYESTLQGLVCRPSEFDIVWAIHALYAVPVNELEIAIERFIFATKRVGFIAHATKNSHYIRFYQSYLDGFKDVATQPFSAAEQIIDIFSGLKKKIEVKKISYQNTVSKNSGKLLEGYLQRCLFDNTISLEMMLENPCTGAYLDECLKDETWCFNQEVLLIFL